MRSLIYMTVVLFAGCSGDFQSDHDNQNNDVAITDEGSSAGPAQIEDSNNSNFALTLAVHPEQSATTNTAPIRFVVQTEEPVNLTPAHFSNLPTGASLSISLIPPTEGLAFEIALSNLPTNAQVNPRIAAGVITSESGRVNVAAINPDVVVNYDAQVPPAFQFSELVPQTNNRRTTQISGSCEAGSRVTITGDVEDSPLVSDCGSEGSYSQDVRLTGDPGTKTIEVLVTDAAGNTSTMETLNIELETAQLALMASDLDSKVRVVKVEENGDLTTVSEQDSWTHGQGFTFLPSAESPSHVLVYAERSDYEVIGAADQPIALVALGSNGLPASTAASTLAPDSGVSYRFVIPSPVPGKAVGIQRTFGTQRYIDNFDIDLAGGSLTRTNQFLHDHSSPENFTVYNNRLYLLNHTSHGMAIHSFDGDGELSSTEDSFYGVCGGTGLCNGGFPFGEIVAHPDLPILYEVSGYHDKLAVADVSAADGSVTWASQTIDTRNRPLCLEISSSGRWLLVGHSYEAANDTYLQVFEIENDGSLNATAVHEHSFGEHVGFSACVHFDPTERYLYVRSPDKPTKLLRASFDQSTGTVSSFTEMEVGLDQPGKLKYFRAVLD